MSPAPKGSVSGYLSFLLRHDREFLCVTLASVLEVHLLLERTDDLARIIATNTGIKIPQDALPHLSEEFFRSKNTKAVIGTDGRLNPSVVRDPVDRFDVEIEAQSVEGEATAFTLTLPLVETPQTDWIGDQHASEDRRLTLKRNVASSLDVLERM